MPTITIVFRGLMVFNKQQVQGRDMFEIGILDERSHHKPRIMKIRNGVREETFLLDQLMDTPPVLWELVVDDPATQGITLRGGEGPIDRRGNTTPEDHFGWIINLENNEFPYGNIDQTYGLDRSELKHVVTIRSGEFYTRLKSKFLERQSIGGANPIDFGPVAGVIGCDIQINSGAARLITSNPDSTIFTFESEDNLLYELSNSPSDIDVDRGNHFAHYYDIFVNQPGEKFEFLDPSVGGPVGTPAPNPALCGKIYLSEFNGSLLPTDGPEPEAPSKAKGPSKSKHQHVASKQSHRHGKIKK